MIPVTTTREDSLHKVLQLQPQAISSDLKLQFFASITPTDQTIRVETTAKMPFAEYVVHSPDSVSFAAPHPIEPC